MRMTITRSTLALALGLGMIAGSAQAADFFVKSTWTNQGAVDADPAGAGLTFGTDAFATIGAAVTAARNNGPVDPDTITVYAGNYSGALNLNNVAASNITLLGPNANIDPNTGTRVAEAIVASGLNLQGTTDVTVNGFTFTTHIQQGNVSTNSTISHNRFMNLTASNFIAGGGAVSGTNLLFTRNLISGVTGNNNSGLNMFAGGVWSDVEISFNTFQNISYAGIQPNAMSNLRILGNTISNTGRHAINIGPGISDLVIAGNIITNVNFQNNRSDVFTGGIRLYSGGEGVSNVTIDSNVIDNANNGIYFRPVAGVTDVPSSLTITNNSITNSTFYGIGIGGTAEGINGDINLDGNYIAGNTLGDDNSADLPAGGTVVTTNPSAQPPVLDTDGDGIPDWQEIFVLGTDPNDPDQDGDGVPDGIQIALGGDPLTSTPATSPTPGTGDSDGDGFLDTYEALVGTDFNDPNSVPTLGDVNGNGVIDNGDAAIAFGIVAGTLPPFAFNRTRLDANLDGTLNNQDVNALFGRFLGLAGFETLPASND